MMSTPAKRAAGNGYLHWRSHAGRWLPLAVVVILLFVAWRAGWLDHVSLSSLIRHREAIDAYVAANPVLSFLAYFIVYAVLVAVSFPGASLLTIVSGLLFGWMMGGVVSVAAATAGATAIFLIARTSFGDFLERRAGPFVSRMVDGFHKDAFHYLLFLRLTPVFPFWVINIVPALLNMKLGPYVLATALGIIPGSLVYAYVGVGLDSVIVAQQQADPGCAQAGTCVVDPSALVTPQMLIALAALAVISVLPVIIRKWRATDSRG